MICTEEQYLIKDDFNCIGEVAQHCNNEKLCIAINEAKYFDILPLICDEFWNEALLNFNSKEEFWTKLWCGGTFNCNGIKINHLGLKRLWVYYSYSRYIMLNSYNDTATGFKQKTDSYSLPTPIKELQVYENKYRDMAWEVWKKTQKFICVNKSKFSSNCLDCSDCSDCENEKGSTKKRATITSNIIKK